MKSNLSQILQGEKDREKSTNMSVKTAPKRYQNRDMPCTPSAILPHL